MVIEVEILVSSMPSKRRCISSMESMATPTFPTSPTASGWSESRPICVGRSKATEILVAFVGFLGVAHAGVLAHGPKASAVHGGLHAASEWILAGIADLAVVVP